MPNKRVDNLKNDWERKNAQHWQSHFGVKNMTTNELKKIEANGDFDRDPDKVRARIEKERKRR